MNISRTDVENAVQMNKTYSSFLDKDTVLTVEESAWGDYSKFIVTSHKLGVSSIEHYVNTSINAGDSKRLTDAVNHFYSILEAHDKFKSDNGFV